MSTPVTFIVVIDGSTKLQEHIANISQFIESTLNNLKINDDLGFVLCTDVMQAVFPLIILRHQNQNKLKQELLKELSTTPDVTSRSRPTKPLLHALNLLKKRSKQDQWRPTYMLFITDGRPIEEDIVQFWDLTQKLSLENVQANELGPIFLDVVVFNKHHPKKEFAKAVIHLNKTVFCGSGIVRIRSRIDIVKTVWQIRDRMRQARDSVEVSDISASVAKRRAPGHVRIPSVFKK